ncbi:methionine ABC transporter ATP-binding protein [Craterilacuibacter sinensis]|uniref:Cell division ATP-binding protein FtsE n=1 Tax=Craterilacuibacter sinensis TaxID=2686017 RepID=A0A845BIX4_9NEIS|nr:ATP-binding cassette domain-containing protein [Craterilacuibacter sinensis]MXR36235.1 ATP-binding cassette domain-containing protein [Craterilacuibacter sinensis]RQW24161.1 ATP-binding cassette domain-containing protein [Rhodobacteraceae bacterium CH30]
MIHLNNVSKRFRHPDGGWFDAVRATTLSIAEGEIFGLIGFSGAGKSTLLRLINLLERPEAGAVLVDGQDLTRLSASELRRARQNIGMVFQQFNLLANRTVAENVAFPLEIAGWNRADIALRVAECLEVVGLTDRAEHYPAQLSGGQKQRVGIARALAPRPKVILADEPTSALDPKTTQSVLQCLADINARFGVTIVLVTHEMGVVRAICQRAALLDGGSVVEVMDVKQGEVQALSSAARDMLEAA